MTRTLAAADAALPNDRRAFLGNSLALATLVTASAVAPASASEHPDAALLALGREWEASVAREVAAYRTEVEADARYVSPPRPEGAYWRTDEVYRYVYPELGKNGRPTGRHFYAHDGIAHFRDVIRRLEAKTDLADWDRKDLSRAKEIVAAFDEYEAEDRRRYRESGFEAAIAAQGREVEHNRRLIWQIVRTPARTLDGIMLKARAILWTQHDTVTSLEKEWAGVSAGDPGEEEQNTALLLDVLRLGAVTHAAGSAVRA